MRRLQSSGFNKGLTVLELLIVVTLLAILVSVAMPLSRASAKREKEIALRQALREMRDAIDQFKADWEAKKISRLESDADIVNSATGYPAHLDVLVTGAPRASIGSADPFEDRPDERPKIYYLRRLPKDPFYSPQDQDVPEWGMRCYEEDPDDLVWCGKDIYDVFSLSDKTGINGIAYSMW